MFTHSGGGTKLSMHEKKIYHYESGTRRDAIVRSAIDTFARYGFRGSTIKRLARDAGISEALVYRYFSSKEDLFEAVLDYLVRQAEPVTPENGETLDDRCFLQKLAEGIYAHYSNHPEEVRILLYAALQGHSLSRRYYERQLRIYYDLIVERIQKGQEEGKYREANPEVTARAFLGMLNYHVMVRTLFRDPGSHPDESSWLTEFTRIFFEGLCR